MRPHHAAGARFSDRVTGKLDEFAPNAKVIHIDIDPAEIGKIREANVPIVGDAQGILGASWLSSRNRALRLSMPNGSKR
mgnify:CR=1 FL=1